MVTETGNRINIKTLALEQPTREPFDVTTLVSQTDWAQLLSDFEKSDNVHDKVNIALALKLMKPDTFGQIAQGFWREVEERIRITVMQEYNPLDFLPMAADAKLLFGIKINDLIRDIDPQLEVAAIRSLRDHSKDPMSALNQAFLLKVLFPEVNEQGYLEQRFDKFLGLIEGEMPGDMLTPTYHLFLTKVLYPLRREIPETFIGETEYYPSILEFLKKMEKRDDFAKLITRAYVILADKVEMTDEGLQVSYESNFAANEEPLPETRRF